MIKRKSPWGVLNGVRPTKKARKLLADGVDLQDLPKVLHKNYKIAKSKVQLLMQTLQNQQKSFCTDSNFVDFYVNIPVCPTRCSYCSFISAELCAVADIMPTYLDKLAEEIGLAYQILQSKNLTLRSVYIGGGTPTVLTASQLETLLTAMSFAKGVEFTVECGRPDTITREKLEVLKKFGVTRISINPQTFCQQTLLRIGRQHTVEQVFEAFALAKQIGFDVNMDLIAGLEGESFSTFKKSLNIALGLNPENLTVHTLSIKNGSELQGKNITNYRVGRMVNYANKKLTKVGYGAYYMYRQKKQLGNLENIGYSKPHKQCLFNIDSMEETISILACGANAISKFVDIKNEKIERAANVKFLHDYINRFDEQIKKKNNLFKNNI